MGDRIQAPGDRRLGVAPHCPPRHQQSQVPPGSDGPDNHPLSPSHRDHLEAGRRLVAVEAVVVVVVRELVRWAGILFP